MRSVQRPRSIHRLSPVGLVATMLLACTAACDVGGGPTRTIALNEQKGSGVSGTVEFTEMGRKTAVTIKVDPAGNPDMPAHIHPGTCDKMIPQPKFPLESVKDGSSSTVVPATIEELFAGGLALNTHKSNDEMKTSTACVEIK